MQLLNTRLEPRDVVAVAALGIALPTLGASWAILALRPGTAMQSPTTMLLTLCLMAALIGCFRFPIHIRVSSKIYMFSVVLYLMATLLPPALAATAAGLGTFVGELTVQHRTGNPITVSITQACRCLILALLASIVAHLDFPGSIDTPILLGAAAAVLWLGDIVSFPALLCPITGERPVRIMKLMIRESGLPEGAQYLVGMLGALEVSRGIWTLVLLLLPTALVYVAFKNTKEMHDETRRILESMADTVDFRDPYTGGHSRRVTDFTERILKHLDKSGPEAKLVISAARVHDIGKIGIPDGILMKNGKLTDEEWTIMKEHPERGADLLARYPDFTRGVEIIRHHHESWDGTGYPHRLKGAEIPFGARVIAVADSYDAMTSDRPYRRGMSPDVAAGILRDGRGTQWDPQVVDAFLRAIATELTERSRPRLHLVQPEVSQAVG